MAAAARAGGCVEGCIVADQESELGRALRIEIGADSEPALAERHRLPLVGVDQFPDLDVFHQMGGGRIAPRERETRVAADMRRCLGAAVEFDDARVPQRLDAPPSRIFQIW